MCVWIKVRVLGDKMPVFRFKGGSDDTDWADSRRYRERCSLDWRRLIFGCELAGVHGIRYRFLVKFRWAGGGMWIAKRCFYLSKSMVVICVP